jgi:hypothetical protein
VCLSPRWQRGEAPSPAEEPREHSTHPRPLVAGRPEPDRSLPLLDHRLDAVREPEKVHSGRGHVRPTDLVRFCAAGTAGTIATIDGLGGEHSPLLI